jgi:hypothetical protein
MRVVDQRPGFVRSLILASTTACEDYEDYEAELDASARYQARTAMCTDIGWD